MFLLFKMIATRKGEYRSTDLVPSSVVFGRSVGLNGSSEVLFVFPDSASSSPSQSLKMIPHHQRGIVRFRSVQKIVENRTT